ncbi:hypothetical protein BC827DRAFT_1268407 [Russula dissimulans]|nr:hypothetical protein BC827DRAFT_1268407 [Russula dissimulans]
MSPLASPLASSSSSPSASESSNVGTEPTKQVASQLAWQAAVYLVVVLVIVSVIVGTILFIWNHPWLSSTGTRRHAAKIERVRLESAFQLPSASMLVERMLRYFFQTLLPAFRRATASSLAGGAAGLRGQPALALPLFRVMPPGFREPQLAAPRPAIPRDTSSFRVPSNPYSGSDPAASLLLQASPTPSPSPSRPVSLALARWALGRSLFVTLYLFGVLVVVLIEHPSAKIPRAAARHHLMTPVYHNYPFPKTDGSHPTNHEVRAEVGPSLKPALRPPEDRVVSEQDQTIQKIEEFDDRINHALAPGSNLVL